MALGQPLPNLELQLLRLQDLRVLAPSEQGQGILAMRGVQVARAFVPQLLARAPSEWHLTGDVVCRDAQGTLRFVGRAAGAQHLVKVLGVQVPVLTHAPL